MYAILEGHYQITSKHKVVKVLMPRAGNVSNKPRAIGVKWALLLPHDDPMYLEMDQHSVHCASSGTHEFGKPLRWLRLNTTTFRGRIALSITPANIGSKVGIVQ